MNSMTGMGRARGRIGSSHVLVEIKSVNHKYCEVHTRLPSQYQSFEIPIIQMVKKLVNRGKVDVWVYEERVVNDISISRRGLREYYRFLKSVQADLGLEGPIELSHIQHGSSYWVSRDVDVRKYWSVVKKLVSRALGDLMRMRKREGGNIRRQMKGRVKLLAILRGQVGSRRQVVLESHQLRFRKRLENLLSEVVVDENRVANEVAFYAEKSDISEELERLDSHGQQMEKMLDQSQPCGRPLDFLIQEINREWNTISSKAQDASVAHWVVQAKGELEKIREQVQNIE